MMTIDAPRHLKRLRWPRWMPATLPRFALVGSCAVLINLVLFELTVHHWGWTTAQATLLAFFALKPVAYLAHKQFTFRLQERWRLSRFALFCAQQAALLVMNIALMSLLVDHLGLRAPVASLVLSASLFLVNYFLSARLTFRVWSR